jgi:hypothetical protein
MNIENVTNAAQATGTPVASPAPVVGTATGEVFNPSTATTAVPATATPAAATAPAATPATNSPRRVQMTPSELNDRIARAKAAAFRDVFGTDDVTTLRAKMQRAEELEQQAEAARLSQMSEIERAKHEADRARQEAARYRTELVRSRERETVREQQSVVERLAARHVNPLYLEEASVAFARDIASRDPKEVARMGEKDITAWFQGYVKRKPAFASSPNARRSEVRPAGAQTPPPRPTTPANGTQVNGSKTFRPGLSNSMSREEAKAEARRLGYSW